MIPQPLSILFGAGLTVGTAWAAGSLLLSRTAPRLHRTEEAAVSFLAGSAVLSTVVFALCSSGTANWRTLLAVSALILGVRLALGDRRPRPDPLAPLSRWQNILFFVPFAGFSAVYFFWAMAPEVSPDGAGYHLGLVSRYLREGGFRTQPSSIYACLSQGLEMLFVHAFAFGKHSAAAMVHLAFLPALIALMVGYARRTGMPDAGLAGALLVYASPVVGIDASSAYNDVATACVLFAAFFLLHVWDEIKRFNILFLIGLLAGFGFAVKYTAFLAVPFALGWISWRLRRSRGRFLQAVTAFSAAAAAMISPWMVKNWITVANPLAPFFNRWFPNPYVSIDFEVGYRDSMRHFGGLQSDWQIPWAAIVDGGPLGGLLGPVFLLAPLALLALRFPRGRLLLAAAALFGSTYAANIGTRFLIPMLPFLALAMGLALSRWRSAAVAVAACHAVLSWPYFIDWYSDPNAWRINYIPFRQAMRIVPEEEYLSQRLGTYRSARLVEEKVPPGSHVFSISGTADAYTTREVHVGYQSAWNNLLHQVLWSPLAEHYHPAGRILFRFAPQSLRRLRVVESGSGIADWGVNELRILYQSKEISRAPEWRLRAYPNPWDVIYAFDNSPLTPWRARQKVLAGMFVEVDLGRSTVTDSVLIECACDIQNQRLRLEGQTETSDWKPLDDKPERWFVEKRASWNRAAAADLKALGIDYLLIDDWDFYADRYRKDPAAWGLRLVGESGGSRLYQIE